MTTLYPLKAIMLDANGIPLGHHAGLEAAVDKFRYQVNAVLDYTNHINQYDAETLLREAVDRYLSKLEQVQREQHLAR